MKTKTISTIAVLTSMSIACVSQAEHADLLLIRDVAGNLITGQYDFDSGQVVNTGTRVYEGEFDVFGTSDEPGFNALSSSNIPVGYQPLAGNTAVSFDANSFQVGSVSANLFYWDGQGAVNFTAATNSLTISKAPSAVFSALLDGSDSDVDGFDIATTSSDGFLHKHIDFGLSDISSSANGFYLWSLSFQSGNAISDPAFFVHGFGLEDEEAHEAAVDWVGSNIVPTPGTMAMVLGFSFCGVSRRR